MIAVLAGGVGAARFLSGLIEVIDPRDVVAIVNVGDDMELHGLSISPDIDTVTYTLAGAINTETGWGLQDESWQAMATVGRYGGPTWFGLGDRDLGTHLYRTGRLQAGATLAEVTAAIAEAWEVRCQIVPVTNDRLRTMVTVVDGGHEREVEFQQYFVGLRHDVPVRAIRFDGADDATPAPGVLDALSGADVIVIAPSNPIVSIGPVLAVPAVRDAVVARRNDVVAVSPIVAGAALKGPADRMLTDLGHESSVVGVARLYADLARVLVIDEQDADAADTVRVAGMEAVVTRSIMSTPDAAASLAKVTIDAAANR